MPLAKGADGYVVRLGDVARVGAGVVRAPRLLPQQRRAATSGSASSRPPPPTAWTWPSEAKAEAERIKATLARGHRHLRRLRQHHLHRRRRWIASTRRWSKRCVLVLVVIWLFLGSCARRADPGGDRAGLPDRLVHRAVRVRFLDQPADPAGAGAVHRPGGGRCHRGAGEHPAPRRPRRAAAGRRQARHRAGRVRGDRHHRGAGGGVPAGRLHGGQYRAPVPRAVGGAGRRRWRSPPSSR